MDFEKAAALATAWVDIVCEGQARIVREATIAKPYGWIFFYQAKEHLDNGSASARLAGNAPIIVNRSTSELRVTGTAKPLKHYLEEYEKTLSPVSLQRAPQLPTW
jgi:immunity protein 35 of polymorphic toxin system